MPGSSPDATGVLGASAGPAAMHPAAIGPITEQGAVIAQGLRYVNAWKGKTAVVKFGGSVLEPDQGGDVTRKTSCC